MALAGVVFILVISLIALLGPFIRPDSTQHANIQNLNISKQKPGFEVDVLWIDNPNYLDQSLVKGWLKYGYESKNRYVPIDSVRIANSEVEYIPFKGGVWTKSGVKYELKRDIYKELSEKGILGSKKFVLGTDRYGRDLLSRLMAGSAISMSVGLIAVFISLLVGISLGALAGYYGGWVDQVIMWLINVIWSIPTLLLVMAIVFAFGKGFEKVFIAVGLTMWVEVARIVRGQVLSIREKEFVEASKALGYKDSSILFGQILPNIMGPIIVISAANFASAILIESGLSFLGIGAQIPTPSWGNMIKEHYSFITSDLSYLAYLPGIMIMSVVLAFMLVGNGLRDANDVKMN